MDTTFTETPVEELTPIDLNPYAAAATEALLAAEAEALQAAATAAAEASVPRFGSGYLPQLVRVYGYVLALWDRIQRDPDMTIEAIRAELVQHRGPYDAGSINWNAALVMSEPTRNALLVWNMHSSDILNPNNFTSREMLVTGIRNLVEEVYEVLAKLDEELLGLPGSDGGKTP